MPRKDIKKETKQEKKTATVDELNHQLAEKDTIIQDYTNHLKRLQADFENYMKRAEKDRLSFLQFSTEKLITKLLIILDDFERALDHMKHTQPPEDVLRGVDMIFTEFHKILLNEGVRPIEAQGKKFDPYYHEVIAYECTDDCPENTVIQELQKGYLLNDRVLRYAKVKISKPKKQKTETTEGEKK